MPIERWQGPVTYELPRPAQVQPQPLAPQQGAHALAVALQPPPLRMIGQWLRVADLLPAKRLIKIAASGMWLNLYPNRGAIGPDGYLDLTVPPEQLILASAPPGALLGKIGGSTADRITGDKKADGVILFPIGTYCVVPPLEKAAPLFVAVNGAQTLADFEFQALTVQFWTSEP
jgi:hypothetical protein